MTQKSFIKWHYESNYLNDVLMIRCSIYVRQKFQFLVASQTDYHFLSHQYKIGYCNFKLTHHQPWSVTATHLIHFDVPPLISTKKKMYRLESNGRFISSLYYKNLRRLLLHANKNCTTIVRNLERFKQARLKKIFRLFTTIALRNNLTRLKNRAANTRKTGSRKQNKHTRRNGRKTLTSFKGSAEKLTQKTYIN